MYARGRIAPHARPCGHGAEFTAQTQADFIYPLVCSRRHQQRIRIGAMPGGLPLGALDGLVEEVGPGLGSRHPLRGALPEGGRWPQKRANGC